MKCYLFYRLNKKKRWKSSVRCWNKIKSEWRKKWINYLKPLKKKKWKYEKISWRFINKTRFVAAPFPFFLQGTVERDFYELKSPFNGLSVTISIKHVEQILDSSLLDTIHRKRVTENFQWIVKNWCINELSLNSNWL